MEPFNALSQNAVKVDGTLEAQPKKSDYILLEPVYVKFKVTVPSAAVPRLSEAITASISFRGKTRQFRGLSSNVADPGNPQKLPETNVKELLGMTATVGILDDALMSSKQVAQGDKEKNKTVESGSYSYESEEVIERVEDFFPEPGNYQIRFYLFGAASNSVDITIVEPTGIDKEAFDFLKRYKNPLTFEWVSQEKNGLALLKTFVDKYGDSVYGEAAVYQLGLSYFYKAEFEKAKVLFEKLKNSKNKNISKNAEDSLRDIKQNIEAKERTKNE